MAERLTGLQEFVDPTATPLVRQDSVRLIDDQDAGTSVTGTLGFTYVNDTRERGVDPSRGWVFSVSSEVGVGNNSRPVREIGSARRL